MQSRSTSHQGQYTLSNRKGSETYLMGGSTVRVERVRSALLTSSLLTLEEVEAAEAAVDVVAREARAARTRNEPVIDEPVIDAPVIDEPVIDEPVIDDLVIEAADSTSDKPEPGCGQMSLPGFDGGSVDPVTTIRRAPLLEPLPGSLFATQVGQESEVRSRQSGARGGSQHKCENRSEGHSEPTGTLRSPGPWQPALPALRVGKRAIRPLVPQSPVAAQHLDAAARLSRQICATRRRSPEQVKTGRAICQHLLALLREESEGVS